MLPLVFADTGGSYVISGISGSPTVRQHLESMGLTVGSTVKVVSSLAGNLILQVKESRVALGCDLAKKIMINNRKAG